MILRCTDNYTHRVQAERPFIAVLDDKEMKRLAFIPGNRCPYSETQVRCTGKIEALGDHAAAMETPTA